MARRRLLHRRVAEALVGRRGQRDLGPVAGQIARHYQLAGRDAEAADYFKQAGEHARTLYANRDALSHFKSALALGHPDAAALHEAIGDVQTLLGEYSAALTTYETAAASCEAGELANLEHKLGKVYLRRGQWDLAESQFRVALDALDRQGEAPPPHLFADWSLAAHHLEQNDRALELAQRALDLAQTTGDRRALAQSHNILGILARSRGEPETARRHLEQGLNLAEGLGAHGARVAALNNLALVHSDQGATERALASAEEALELCVTYGDRHRQAALHNNIADLLHAAGQADAAMAHLKQAAVVFAEIGQDAGDWQPEIWKLVEW